MERQIGQYTFELVEEIRPQSDDSGFVEYTKTLRSGARPLDSYLSEEWITGE